MKTAWSFIIATIILLAAWHVYAVYVISSSVVFPSPPEIFSAFMSDFDRILSGVGLTMIEALVGFVVAAVLGYAMALAFYIVPPLRNGLYPYAIILKATPLVAIAPILVLWLGDGFAAKAVMAAVVAFFPVLVSSYVGLRRYDSESLVFFKSLGASESFILRSVIVPGSIPYLFSGLRIGSTLAVVGAIIAEFTGATAGAGYLIKTYSYYLDTKSMFATVISLGIASVMFFFSVAIVERLVVFWEKVD